MSLSLLAALTIMTIAALTFVIRPMVSESRRNLVVILAVCIPVFAAGAYRVLGSPNAPGGHATASTAMASTSTVPMTGGEKVGSVGSMIEGLATRLEENPDDGKGWLLLARSYQHLGRTDDAAEAYAQAVALGESDADFESKTATKTMLSPSSSPLIAGSLSLSDKAAAMVKPDDIVFVFARGTNGAGPPAAVLRKSAADLPLNFELNDSQSMVDSIKLSQFEEVIVTARISRSGDANEALQGLEARSAPLTVTDNNRINLIIE